MRFLVYRGCLDCSHGYERPTDNSEFLTSASAKFQATPEVVLFSLNLLRPVIILSNKMKAFRHVLDSACGCFDIVVNLASLSLIVCVWIVLIVPVL